MSGIEQSGAHFAGFDYKEVTAAGQQLLLCLDCYPCFGWTVTTPAQSVPSGGSSTVLLKRERSVMNKAELTRLQNHFEACVREMQALERSKTTVAARVAVLLALIGTVFMAGATFAVTHEPPQYVLMAVLAIPGFAGWILPYFVYRRLVSRREKLVAALLEQKYDEICHVCDQGKSLL